MFIKVHLHNSLSETLGKYNYKQKIFKLLFPRMLHKLKHTQHLLI